ncbi:hypothetical protein FGO68_gene10424 [Halteria grandinella]|uniref:Uncharacterized protein n=1 Tax=Halteria grandinella TaxID=5974 RepID=A0A8J8P461_HALGN|nr:hypothetical protein FGO68_gene10424 [Halteria grandinella]
MLQQSLRKAWAEIFDYIQSDSYEDGEQQMNNKAAKGLWYFTDDILLQYAFYLTGLFFQLRGSFGETQMKSRFYYLQSLQCLQIKYLEHRLLKKVLKRLSIVKQMPMIRNQQSLGLQRLLQKFYVKQRCVHVIMELCNKDPSTHDTILSFIKKNIFEQLYDTDYFGLTTLRSGKQPFAYLPLDQKQQSTKMKRKQITELNYITSCSSSMTGEEEVSSDLEMALSICAEQLRQAGHKGRFEGPLKWIIAFVGPQWQELREIYSELESNKENINLIIIGIEIKDPELCLRYRELTHLTPEGYFVNLSFNQVDYFFEENINDAMAQQNYVEILARIEATIQLFYSKRQPFIAEQIDFN